jgi:hypothetical protein
VGVPNDMGSLYTRYNHPWEFLHLIFLHDSYTKRYISYKTRQEGLLNYTGGRQKQGQVSQLGIKLHCIPPTSHATWWNSLECNKQVKSKASDISIPLKEIIPHRIVKKLLPRGFQYTNI